MTARRIETQLTIKAVDQYTEKLQSMRAVTGRFADGVRAELSNLQKQRGALKLIDDFKEAQARADQAREAFSRQKSEVRRLREEMRNAERPTAAMSRAFEAAKNKAERLRTTHHRQLEKLRGLNERLKETGINAADLGAEQRRLRESMDGATTSVDRQMERMRRLGVMQDRIAAARKRRDDALGLASNLGFVGSAATHSGRRLLTPLSQVVNRSGDLDAKFVDFQNLTGADDTRLARLREELDGLRDVTKTSVSDMLDGLAVLVGKGMGFEDALAALPAAGRAAKATKTSFDEMGASGFALYDNLKVAPEELRKAFDIMAMGGKEGGFELSAMARTFPEITAGARALKMEGLDSVAQLTAALQIAMKSAGSEDQAATNLANFLGKLTSPETVRRFAKMGVSIEDELRKAAESGVSPFEHMLGVIDDLTGGDALKMGELFGDKQVLDFLRAMIPNLEEYRRIKDAALSADGVVDADFEKLLNTFNESKAQLGESVANLFVLPPEVLESFTELFQKADAIVERMIAWKKENPKLVKTLFLGATALGAMAVAGGALLTTAAGLIGTMAVLRFGLVSLGARAAFAAGSFSGIGGAFRGLMRLPKFALSRLIVPLRWTAGLLPAVQWSGLISRTAVFGMNAAGWGRLITPLKWFGRGALRLIPVIGWAAMAAEIGLFAWKYLGLNKLPWADWIPDIDWSYWFSFEWVNLLPVWSWDFIPSLNLADKVSWFGAQLAPPQSDSPSSGWKMTPEARAAAASGPIVPPPVEVRAGGGPVRTGVPYLVNENTPRSEWFVPSRSGGVLNVGQAQAAFRSHLSSVHTRSVGRNPELARLHRGAQGLRAASIAVLTSSALVAPAAAQPAQGARPGSGAVTVQIENFTVHVPSGVSDPEAIADLVSDRIGRRVAATMSASFSD